MRKNESSVFIKVSRTGEGCSKDPEWEGRMLKARSNAGKVRIRYKSHHDSSLVEIVSVENVLTEDELKAMNEAGAAEYLSGNAVWFKRQARTDNVFVRTRGNRTSWVIASGDVYERAPFEEIIQSMKLAARRWAALKQKEVPEVEEIVL